jgi:peptide/nickel transport system permease protein
VSMIPYYGRLARAQTLSQMRNEYVRAERALGASRARVLRTHVMPNALAPLLVIVAIDIPTAIAIEAGLAFLGLGVQPPTPDWGVMLNDGFTVIGTSVWPIAGPIAALVLVTTSFTVLGETLRDELDPRSAGRVRGRR